MNNTQTFFLSHAGYTVKFIFRPTDLIYAKNELVAAFKKTWGHFLVKNREKVNFRIIISPEVKKGEIIAREYGKKYFFLTFSRDFENKKITTYYTSSLRTLDLLIREIFAYLLVKKGFLLHCSSIVNRKGELNLFMARSGGGKTTITKLLKSKDFRVFNDDIIIVKRFKKKWLFFSPPFIEKERRPVKKEAVAAKCFIIKKAKVGYTKRILRKKKILPFLLGQIWLPEGKMDSAVLKNAVKFLHENTFSYLGVCLHRKEMERLLDES